MHNAAFDSSSLDAVPFNITRAKVPPSLGSDSRVPFSATLISSRFTVYIKVPVIFNVAFGIYVFNVLLRLAVGGKQFIYPGDGVKLIRHKKGYNRWYQIWAHVVLGLLVSASPSTPHDRRYHHRRYYHRHSSQPPSCPPGMSHTHSLPRTLTRTNLGRSTSL